jgi:hypothetical protein
MKALFYLGMAGLMMSCSTPQTKRTTILVDVTENEASNIVLGEESGIGTPTTLWHGQIVRFGLITDVNFNTIRELKLEAEIELFGNHDERQKKVNSFLSKVSHLPIILKDSTQQREYPYSCIWNSLMRELTHTRKDAIPTTIYLVSDLLEHGLWVSMYHPKTIKQLRDNPTELKELFASHVPNLPKMDHVELIIIHTPKDITQDEVFNLIIREIYEPILHEYGITVSVKGSLHA